MGQHIEWRWPRITLRGHQLHTYLWDARMARAACNIFLLGTGQILLRTWRWIATGSAAPKPKAKPKAESDGEAKSRTKASIGDQLFRAGSAVGVVVGAVCLVDRWPVAANGIVLLWLGASAALAPRDAWKLPPVQAAKTTDVEAVEEACDTPADDVPEDPREALLDLLDEVTRGRNGVHLEELARHPDLTGLPRPQLGPLLEAHGVPVTRSLSVAGVAGRSGVRRADVEALLTTLPQGATASPHEAALAPADLRKSQPLSPALSPALATVSTAGDQP